ncbi:MAG: sigma-70 family RNA polymerase sigma factor [Nitriliruptor sp.]|uniref:sigma-70 family RNA polymerase sigma factor n=1 Tax=Nitriliruptor sp. TaxID=2448056 RepID=UPI0034A01FB2
MSVTVATTPVTGQELERTLEAHRRELTGYCYRMLGSSFEAEDAVQDTMVRAWRSHDRFEGRASLRTWLYRIATNVCMDALAGRQRRAQPVDMGPAAVRPNEPGPALPEYVWLEPAPDGRVLPAEGDPAELAVARESIRLAFAAALQHLPPRQRAVLVLREVLRLRATEVAELLATSVPSVNSALQRARATLAERGVSEDAPAADLDPSQLALLERYVDAFERYDLGTLTSLLTADATMSMPPFALWLRGPEEVAAWMAGPGAACEGSRIVATRANGRPAYGQYKPSPDGGFTPWALQVVTVDGDRITDLVFFLDTDRLFPLFDLPLRLDA